MLGMLSMRTGRLELAIGEKIDIPKPILAIKKRKIIRDIVAMATEIVIRMIFFLENRKA